MVWGFGQAKAKLVELYSPPGVTRHLQMPCAVKQGILPGATYDLVRDAAGRSWDFTDPKQRQKARSEIAAMKPYMVIGSPPCTQFCRWQRVNHPRMDPKLVNRELVAARAHVGFCVQVYRDQLARGAHYLHEHPEAASPWHLLDVERLAEDPRSIRVTMDMCQYGMTQRDANGNACPIYKPTSWLTSAAEVAKELTKRCPDRKGHGHVTLRGGRCKAAPVYSPRVCRAIVRGIPRQSGKGIEEPLPSTYWIAWTLVMQ